MRIRSFLAAAAVAATASLAATQADAVSITFNPVPGGTLGSGFADGSNIGDLDGLGVGSTVYLNPRLRVIAGGDLTYIFQGDDAGATNTAYDGFGGGGTAILDTNDALGTTAMVTVGTGLLPFSFCSDGTSGAMLGCIDNGTASNVGGGFALGLAFGNSGRAFLLFGDGAGDADLSDMIVEIRGAQFMAIPLPAAGVLLLVGLGSFAALRSRTRKS